MARHETKRNPRPMLVFASAAALVIALAVPLLLFFRGSGGEAVATTTTVAPGTTTIPQGTTTTIPTSTTTQFAPSIWQGSVFLAQVPDNSFLGNPALVPVWLEVTAPAGSLVPDAYFTEVLASIGSDLPAPYFNAIPPEAQIVSLSVGELLITAEMTPEFRNGAGGFLADVTMLNQLVYTLTSSHPERGVLFTIDGEPVKEFGSDGLDLSESVGLTTFIDDLALIFLTDPITEAEHVYVVSGQANTFEATLNVRVIDISSGDVIHEEFTTATCGTGCWGEFGVGISSDLVTPGQSAIQLLTYSPEDGSPQNVITIPIPEGNVWKYDLG